MPHVCFTPHLKHLVDCPSQDVNASTVRESLDAVFSQNTRLRGYILDDRGQLRQHVVIFVDGKPIVDRERLSDSVTAGSEIYRLTVGERRRWRGLDHGFDAPATSVLRAVREMTRFRRRA